MLYRLDDVRLAFGPREILRGVSYQHNPGEKLVLLGRNGTGKTTLLRVVAGDVEADGGSVIRASALDVARLPQRLDPYFGMGVFEFCLQAFPDLLRAEAEIEALAGPLDRGEAEAVSRLQELQEVVERSDGYRARPRAEAALDAFGIRSELRRRRLGDLSGGERTRVALARALLSPAALLLLDEPTNHLDLLGVDFLAGELEARDGALLLVTHDRQLIDRVGGEILELHAGRVERYPGRYDAYRRERATRREQARKAWEQQQAEIARQEEFIRRNIAGQNTRQAQARQKLLDRMERLEAPEQDLPAVRLQWVAAGRTGDRVLEAEGLAAGWDEPLVQDLSLLLRRGERLALVGRNGAGKTTLLRTLAGTLPALRGSLRFGAGVVPGVYDQETAVLEPGRTVLDTLLDARPDWKPADARGWAGRFGFSGDAAEALTDTLSGGERGRLVLARLIAEGPNLLLLDEPTNHLDIPTCEALEEALTGYPGAVVFISHDRWLVERLADTCLLVEAGRASELQRVEEAFERLGLATAGKGRAVGGDRPPVQRRSPREEERRRLRRDAARARQAADAAAADLEAAETRLREVEELLCRREVFSDAERARDLAEEAAALRDRIDATTERWTELEEDAEALEGALADLE